MRKSIFAAALAVTAAAGSPACGPSEGQASSVRESSARFIRQIEWAGTGVWLKADTHVHSTFSDGMEDVARIAATAVANGCHVLAITDHADHDLWAGTPKHVDAIAAARIAHPGLILLAGLEWNIPPWGGDEHATILLPPGPEEWNVLREFKERFDDLGRDRHDPLVADEALRWLGQTAAPGGVTPVVIYEHPSRKRERSLDIAADVQRWRGASDLVIGFSGAPGHQGASPVGSYKYTEQSIDRWDPSVARVGDAWDTLLQKGLDLWAAHAPSDFHNDYPNDLADPWPGEFAETWLYVPERTAAGVFRAFRAGSFFGAHGRIVREVELSVEAEGLPRPAVAGEVIEVAGSARVTARASFTVPPADWAGKPNRIDAIELIAVGTDGAAIIATRAPQAGRWAFAETVAIPDGGLVLRLRGRRGVEDAPDLMFYSNPIRIVTR